MAFFIRAMQLASLIKPSKFKWFMNASSYCSLHITKRDCKWHLLERVIPKPLLEFILQLWRKEHKFEIKAGSGLGMLAALH